MFPSSPETDMQHRGYFYHNVYNCLFFMTIVTFIIYSAVYFFTNGTITRNQWLLMFSIVTTYNVIDIIWLLLSPKSLEGINKIISLKTILIILCHHIMVIIISSLIVFSPGISHAARLLTASFYLVEINTLFRDLRKFFNINKNSSIQFILYILSTMIFDITWILLRIVMPTFIVAVSIYVLIVQYIDSVSVWFLVILETIALSLQFMWTVTWFYKFKLRVCNYRKYYQKYGNRQQIPQTDISDMETVTFISNGDNIKMEEAPNKSVETQRLVQFSD
eukprot:242752_1